MLESFWTTKEIIPRCKVTMSAACDLPSSYVAFSLMFILLLPFSFVAVCLIKNWKITLAREYLTAASYCITFIIFNVILYFYYYCFYPLIHDRTLDTFTNLASISSDLYIMSVSLFFLTVSRVLVLFKTKLAYISYWISKIFSLYYVCAALVKVVLVYMNQIPYKVRENIFSDNGIYYKYFIQSSEYIIDCISFFILTECILFSDIEFLIPKELILRIKVALFLMAIIEIIVIILRVYMNSIPIKRYLETSPNKYYWIFTLMYFGHRIPIDYVILFIIYSMTLKNWNVEKDNKSHEILNDSITGVEI